MCGSWVSSLVENGTALLNSNFSAALFGAGFGALGASYFTRRAEANADKIKEIRWCNVGVISCASICTACLGLKYQHISSLKSNFERLAEEHETIKNSIEPKGQFNILADYRDIPRLQVNSTPLLEAATNSSISSKSFLMAETLKQSIEQLEELILKHSTLMAEFRQVTQVDQEAAAAKYLGFSHGNIIDTRYRDILNGIADNLDCCIFFSSELVKSFNKRGIEVRGKSNKLPTIRNVTFDPAKLPDPTTFGDWSEKLL